MPNDDQDEATTRSARQLTFEDLILNGVAEWKLREVELRGSQLSAGTKDKILEVQSALYHYRYNDDFIPLFHSLEYVVSKTAEKLEERWRNKGMSKWDFESIMWEASVEVADTYNWTGEHWAYQTMRLAFRRRALDLQRKQTMTKQGRFESSVLPLKEEYFDVVDEKQNVEATVVNRQLVLWLLNHPTLTANERRLLLVMHQEPEASLREWADLLGVSHETVRRLQARIKTKLQEYDLTPVPQLVSGNILVHPEP